MIDGFYANTFDCQVGTLPMKYLGLLVTYSMLKTIDWDFLDAKLLKRLDVWIGSFASSRDTSILLNSSLDGIPSFFMLTFLLNRTVIKKMDTRSRYFF